MIDLSRLFGATPDQMDPELLARLGSMGGFELPDQAPALAPFGALPVEAPGGGGYPGLPVGPGASQGPVEMPTASMSPVGPGASLAPSGPGEALSPVGPGPAALPVVPRAADTLRPANVPEAWTSGPGAGAPRDVRPPAAGGGEPPLPPSRPAELSREEKQTAAQKAVVAPETLSAPEKSWVDKMRDNGGWDAIMAFGFGLAGGKNWGDGFSKGGEAAQRAFQVNDLTKAKSAKTATEAAARAQIVKSLVAKGVDPVTAEAAAGNNTLLQSVLSQVNDKGEIVEVEGNKYRLKAGEKPSDANLLGRAKVDADAYHFTTAPDGATLAIDKKDPSRVIVSRNGEGFRPPNEDERKSWGLEAGKPYKMGPKGPEAIGGGGNSVTIAGPEREYDKKVSGEYADLYNKSQEAGRNSRAALNTLSLMEQSVKDPNFYSGFGGNVALRANQFLGALGVKDAKAASAGEVFDALSNRVILDGLGGSLGAGVSNTDRDFIAKTAPTLTTSPEGNLKLIGIARKLNERQGEIAQMARDYAKKNGRLDAGFDELLDQHAKANPLFPEAAAAATAGPPGNGTRSLPTMEQGGTGPELPSAAGNPRATAERAARRQRYGLE